MLVTYTDEELDKLPGMTPAQWQELAQWQDPYDPDCPPTTIDKIKQFRRVNPHKIAS